MTGDVIRSGRSLAANGGLVLAAPRSRQQGGFTRRRSFVTNDMAQTRRVVDDSLAGRLSVFVSPTMLPSRGAVGAPRLRFPGLSLRNVLVEEPGSHRAKECSGGSTCNE